MAALPVLPDFEVIARSHTDLSRELSRCANLPAMQEGNQILQEIREIRREMREMRDEMRTSFATSNDNNIARLHNSQISNPNQRLMPLRTALSNEPIPLFPNTAAELQRLPNATIIEILRALGSSIDGNASTRKLRLRLQCGLKEEPI